MRKALFKVKQEVISVESITDTSHVGILTQTGKKMQIIKGSIGFQAMLPFDDDISKSWNKSSKLEYIKAFSPEPEVFVFDTLEDLIEWLK